VQPAGVSRATGIHVSLGTVDAQQDLAWINITGVTHRGRFHLRDAGEGRTLVTFRLAYGSEGGLLGLIADRVAARWIGRRLAESLENLQPLVES
jgi:uncharacterized membrane protein